MSDTEETPRELLVAAMADYNIEEAKAALAKDPSILNTNKDEEYGSAPIHEICMDSSEEAVPMLKFLVNEANGDVNLPDQAGEMTPLAFAMMGGNVEAITFLIEKGAKLNTEFFCAEVAASTKANLLKLVLAKGGNVNARDKNTGKTPALMGVLGGDAPSELIPVLKAAGADFFAVDDAKKNIFHLCAMNANTGGDMLKALIENGVLTADGEKVKSMVNARDGTPGQFTPLHDAVCSTNLEVVEILLGQFNADKTLKTVEADDEPEKTVLDLLAECQEALEEADDDEEDEDAAEELATLAKIKALLQ